MTLSTNWKRRRYNGNFYIGHRIGNVGSWHGGDGIIGAGFLYVINTMEKQKIEQAKRKEREKIYGSN